MWQILKTAVIEPCRRHLKPEKLKNREDWMTDIDVYGGERKHEKYRQTEI